MAKSQNKPKPKPPKPEKNRRDRRSSSKKVKKSQVEGLPPNSDDLPKQAPVLMDIDSPSTEATQTFEQWYLRQVTKEFADDLDKIRQSKDFNEASLPILVDALKQGAGLYDERERSRIMGKVS